MTRRKGSSHRWRQRQERDPYVERALREGWRSRAVFKLEEIDRRERLFRPGLCCVDLGAAPGGWSQYAARKVGPTGCVIAIDLLPIDPIEGVQILHADFMSQASVDALRALIGERPVDLVMSDLAPNLSGNRAIDQPRSMGLVEGALEFACVVLASKGAFLTKVFQGEGFPELVASARARFETVKLIKPRASRPESRETYLLARQNRMV